MKTYNTILFDLDGTLLNTIEDLADSVNAALLDLHCPPRSIEEVNLFIGSGVEMLVRRALPAGAEQTLLYEAFSLFQTHYQARLWQKTLPYEGITMLLQILREKNLALAILSNKYQAAVDPLCEHFFSGLYTYAIGEREGIPRKPHPAIVFDALGRMDANPAHTLYVGDSETDVKTAKNAGLDFVGVSWGTRSRGDLLLHGASTVIDTPLELLDVLDRSAGIQSV